GAWHTHRAGGKSGRCRATRAVPGYQARPGGRRDRLAGGVCRVPRDRLHALRSEDQRHDDLWSDCGALDLGSGAGDLAPGASSGESGSGGGVEERVVSREYLVPSTEYRVPSTEYRVPGTEYRG